MHYDAGNGAPVHIDDAYQRRKRNARADDSRLVVTLKVLEGCGRARRLGAAAGLQQRRQHAHVRQAPGRRRQRHGVILIASVPTEAMNSLPTARTWPVNVPMAVSDA